MTPNRQVIEPPIFGQTSNNFSHRKMLMIEFFKTNEVWDIVKNGYVPKFEDNNELTAKSKLEKKDGFYAMNYILSSVSGFVGLLINDLSSAHDM